MPPIRVRLRELREEAGLSQQALAERAQVRQATISDLESGKSQGATFATLERLAAVLSVAPGELFDGTPPKKRR